MKELNNQINYIIKPVAIFVVIFCLLLFTTIFGVKQINDIRSKISDAKKVESGLNNKISTLRTVDTKISENITFVDVALPNRASALYAMNQVKVKAFKFNVLVSNLRSGNAVSEDNLIESNLISFDLDGKIFDIYSFLESFTTTLPIANITKAKISLVGDSSKTAVSLSVYSTELPKQIPSVTSSVDGLTTEEEKILAEISKYDLPQFIERKPSEGVNQKEDPFN